MNYRHIFHAGNFADVFKHWILTLLFSKLVEKEAGLCFMDVHAGVGLYNLDSENAQKTLEADTGVKLILDNSAPIFATYLKIIAQVTKEYGNFYPGSPKIAEYFLRPQDRMLLSELHEQDCNELKSNFKHRRIKIFQQNGYAMLKANLPPLEKRALILIDAPFEQRDEFTQIVNAMQEAYIRFATGIYAIWYPIKDQYTIKQFYKNMRNIGFNKILCIEMHTQHNLATHLSSCGMLIINAPWKLDEQVHTGMPQLLQQLQYTTGSYLIKELAE